MRKDMGRKTLQGIVFSLTLVANSVGLAVVYDDFFNNCKGFDKFMDTYVAPIGQKPLPEPDRYADGRLTFWEGLAEAADAIAYSRDFKAHIRRPQEDGE